MSQFQKGIRKKIQGRNYYPNSEVKEIIEDAKATSELLCKYTEFMHSMVAMMSQFDATTANVFCKLEEIPPRMDSILYKLEDFTQLIMRVQGQLGVISSIDSTSQTLIYEMSKLSAGIETEYKSLHEKVDRMESIIKDLDTVAKDPSINRTIEELKDITRVL